jgi:hypothetical protein
MMVLMALITTFMTGPALDLINWLMPDKKYNEAGGVKTKKTFRLLLSFGSAQTGRKMLSLANQMFGRKLLDNNLTAINLTYNADITAWQLQEFEEESFKDINAEADNLNIRIETRYKPVKDVQRAILRITNKEAYDFLLVDAGKSLFKGTFIGNILEATKLLYPENLFETLVGNKKLLPQLLPADDMMDEKARRFIEDAHCSVGVFIDRKFKTAGNILVLLLEGEDDNLLKYAKQFTEHHNSFVTTSSDADKELLQKFDLLLISSKSWEKSVNKKSPWLEYLPSTLIIKHVS